MEDNFKIGDIVLCNDSIHNNAIGCICLLLNSGNFFPYKVLFLSGSKVNFSKEELTRIYYNAR